MNFIFSLAHFCEFHGPTSILCTQIQPVTCATCDPPPDTPRSSRSTPSPPQREWTPPLYGDRALNTAVETPPTSPATAGSRDNPYFPPTRSSTDSYRRYSGTFESKDDTCANCTFNLPGDVNRRLPDGMPGSPTKDGLGRHGSPVLRTSEGLLVPGCAPSSEDEFEDTSSPEMGSHTESSDTEQPKPPPSTTSTTARTTLHIPSNLARSHTTSSTSSDSALYTTRQHFHRHTIDYVTTRQPPSPTSYTLLRRSCINTLSVENLPRGASAGFLFFGDVHKGYTLAYVFRVPDPRARGRLRSYALLMLGGHDGWRTTLAYRMVTRAFENMAEKIVRMANAVIEREFGDSAQAQGARSLSSVSSSPESVARPRSSGGMAAGADSGYGGSLVSNRSITPVSSFLVAKKVDPDGYPRVSSEAMSAKSLAEIVGDENIFLELHGAFVKLLASLTREFGL